MFPLYLVRSPPLVWSLAGAFPYNEQAAYDYVEARIWPLGATCPKCGERERVGAHDTRQGRCVT